MPGTVRSKPGDRAWLAAADWMKRHEARLLQRDQNRDAEVVFLGDSITEGWGGEGKAAWERHFAGLKKVNLGIGGDETQHILWRMEHGALDGLNPAKLVLLIGTNNIGNSGMNAAQTAEGVKKVVVEIHRRLPKTQILLLAVFPRDAKPGTPYRREIETLNAIISRIEGVKFVDYGPLFLEADGSLPSRMSPDSLHLSAEAYEVLARELAKELRVS